MRTPKLVMMLSVVLLLVAGAAPVFAYGETEPVNACLMIPEAMNNAGEPGSYKPESCLTSGSSLDLGEESASHGPSST